MATMSVGLPTGRKFWIALACVGLAACGTTGERRPRASAGALEVTRFHLGDVIAAGEVVIEPRFATPIAPVSTFASDALAVTDELRRLGFTPGDRRGSEFIATVDVAAGTPLQLQARTPARGEAAPTAPVTPAIAAAGENQAQLAVQLKRRSDGSIVWEGRARMPHAAGQPVSQAQVTRLAGALFRDFPGPSGETIRVR